METSSGGLTETKASNNSDSSSVGQLLKMFERDARQSRDPDNNHLVQIVPSDNCGEDGDQKSVQHHENGDDHDSCPDQTCGISIEPVGESSSDNPVPSTGDQTASKNGCKCYPLGTSSVACRYCSPESHDNPPVIRHKPYGTAIGKEISSCLEDIKNSLLGSTYNQLQETASKVRTSSPQTCTLTNDGFDDLDLIVQNLESKTQPVLEDNKIKTSLKTRVKTVGNGNMHDISSSELFQDCAGNEQDSQGANDPSQTSCDIRDSNSVSNNIYDGSLVANTVNTPMRLSMLDDETIVTEDSPNSESGTAIDDVEIKQFLRKYENDLDSKKELLGDNMKDQKMHGYIVQKELTVSRTCDYCEHSEIHSSQTLKGLFKEQCHSGCKSQQVSERVKEDSEGNVYDTSQTGATKDVDVIPASGTTSECLITKKDIREVTTSHTAPSGGHSACRYQSEPSAGHQLGCHGNGTCKENITSSGTVQGDGLNSEVKDRKLAECTAVDNIDTSPSRSASCASEYKPIKSILRKNPSAVSNSEIQNDSCLNSNADYMPSSDNITDSIKLDQSSQGRDKELALSQGVDQVPAPDTIQSNRELNDVCHTADYLSVSGTATSKNLSVAPQNEAESGFINKTYERSCSSTSDRSNSSTGEGVEYETVTLRRRKNRNKLSKDGSDSPRQRPKAIRNRTTSLVDSDPDSPRQSEDSEDDEDAGVYAESHRHSRWLYMGDSLQVMSIDFSCASSESGKSSSGISASTIDSDVASATIDLDTTSESLSDGGLLRDMDISCDSGAYVDALPKEFGNAKEKPWSEYYGDEIPPSKPLVHCRSESISTTASEIEFRKRYHAKTTRIVQRKSSTQLYQRLSDRFYDEERVLVLERGMSGGSFGFHIQGGQPVRVSTVDAGSVAEDAGLCVGDVIIAVNGVNVLEASHTEVVKLVAADPERVKLSVSADRITLDEPLCMGYLIKQGGSGILKNWRRRWFVLKPDHCLYYYKTEEDKDPLGAILLMNYTISKAPEVNRRFTFKAVKYSQRSYYFQAESDDDMNIWANAMSAAATATSKTDTWLDISSHNVGLPALTIKSPDCHGSLSKLGHRRKNWKRRYCVLKDACLYYYLEVYSSTAQGVAHLHGYRVEEGLPFRKTFGFTLHPPEPNMRTFYFFADNETDKKRWIEALQKSIGRWVKADS